MGVCSSTNYCVKACSCCHCKKVNTSLCIPGVRMPPADRWTLFDNASFLFDISMESTTDLVSFVSKDAYKVALLAGKTKGTNQLFEPIHEAYLKENVIATQIADKGYQYFGCNDNESYVAEFLRTNALFTMALSASRNDKDEVVYKLESICTEENAKPGNPWYARVCAAMANFYVRVNGEFDANFNVIGNLSCYKGDGTLVEATAKEAATYLVSIISYYAELVHASIHVYHYLNVSALYDTMASGETSKMQAAWASPYYPAVSAKYHEVELLLLGKGFSGDLVGASYNVDRDIALQVVSEMFCEWSSMTSAEDFVNKYLLRHILTQECNHIVSTTPITRESVGEHGLLSEYLKHAALIPGYAKDITDVFASENSGLSLNATNKKLAAFYEHSRCGYRAQTSESENPQAETPKISNLQEWTEMMSITGILHGCTLSLTRLVLTQSVACQVTDKDCFDMTDVKHLGVTIGTMIGVVNGRHVCGENEIDRKAVNASMLNVISKYEAASQQLKVDYYDEISKHPKFNELGWIWTDYCVDELDGKQLTITTYI